MAIHGKSFIAQQFKTGLLYVLYCCFSHHAQAEPVEMQSVTSLNSSAILETSKVSGQFTIVNQSQRAFSASYTGPNSLSPNSSSATSTDLTLFAGMRILKNGEIWGNLEIDQGLGLNHVLGMAGYPSGEAYKPGQNSPHLNLARFYYRQIINMGGEILNIEYAANQLERSQTANNIILTLGKFSVTDVFDNNSYAHDPRTDFLNWSIVESGAFDYTADAWGYTKGASIEWTPSRWTFRGGLFDIPEDSNSVTLIPKFSQYEWVGELEERYQIWERPGKVKLMGFVNHGKTGSYQEAVQLAKQTNSTPDTVLVQRTSSRTGAAINLEQELPAGMGAFARASKNAGNKGAINFTDINQSVSAGISLRGDRWERPDDTFGFALAANALSGDARNYFASGGLGIMIGDGKLPHYGSEKIMESYYSCSMTAIAHLMLSLNYQYVVNPAYNRDRGPVSFIGMRVHEEF